MRMLNPKQRGGKRVIRALEDDRKKGELLDLFQEDNAIQDLT